MHKIANLIEELCPRGVAHLPIGDFAECVSGATPISTISRFWENGTIPWMSSGEVNKELVLKTDALITQEGFDSCSTKMVPAGSVVIALAGQGKTRGMVARVGISLCTNQSLCSIITNHRVQSDYLYYFLKGQYQTLRSLSSGDGGRGGLNLQIIRSFKVPIPPMEVQREIVKILDKFTELEMELEAELEARKTQYKHYRRVILSFPELDSVSIRWTTLGEVVRIKNGSDHKHLSDGPYPLYGTGGVMRHVDNYSYDKPSVLIPRKGSLKNLYFMDQPFWTVDTLFYTEIDDAKVYPKFLFHWLSLQELEKLNVAGGVPSLTQTVLNKVKIPLPSIDVQRKVSDVLDAFTALLEDEDTGLPAEIAIRRKQFEHYRGKLLSFRELDVA